jgi:hypothetical protein
MQRYWVKRRALAKTSSMMIRYEEKEGEDGTKRHLTSNGMGTGEGGVDGD